MNNLLKHNFLILLIFSLFFTWEAYSHDIWLSPESFRLSKEDTLIVHQLAGHELKSELELPLLRSITPSFELITRRGTIDLLKELPEPDPTSEIKPVLKRELDFDGQAMVSMEHKFFFAEIPNEKFMKYLEFEELTEKYKAFLKNKSIQLERFARSMKTLIQVGKDTKGDAYKKNLGHKIEIVLLNNPHTLEVGESLEVKVLYDGKHLIDQLVFALNKSDDKELLQFKGHTNKEGVVNFKLKHEGEWLIRLVYLRHCLALSDLDCTKADWESHWAAYSFKFD